MKQLNPGTRAKWREWLKKNHNSETEIWLVYYKKGSDERSVDYEASVEEALCFGWVDSLIKKIDEISYARKFTPRKPGSAWSALNKARAGRMIAQKKMTSAGQRCIDEAISNGQWEAEAGSAPPVGEAPEEFLQALGKHPRAEKEFHALAPSHRKRYLAWINAARRPETRLKRIADAISLLERGEKLGMK